MMLSIVLIFSTFLAVLIWPNIYLPFNEAYNYGGEYLIENYNKHNDTLRFIIFLIVSLSPFLIIYTQIKKSKIFSIEEFLKIENINNLKNNDLKVYSFLIIIFCLFEFLIIDFDIFIGNLDLFHEGLWITSAYNYIKTNQFWASSYFGRGLFGNYFPLIIWNLQNDISIGSVRYAELILILINKVLLVFLAQQIANNLTIDRFKKILFFVLLALFLISTTRYINPGSFVGRSALIILFLNILIFSLNYYRKYNFVHCILGFFSVLSFLWYLDVGAYINFSIIIILITLLLKKDFKSITSILVGILISWFLLFLLLDQNEINYFISNSINIYTTIDQIHGIIYPSPFFSSDSRATKTLLLFVVGGVFTIFICLDKNKFNNNNKIFFFILFFLSIASFKTGLSRSDAPHIKTAIGPLMIVLYTYFLYFLVNFEKFIYFIDKIKIHKKIFYLLLSIIFILNFKIYSFEKIYTSLDKIKNLTTAKDELFLTDDKKKYLNLIEYYSEISRDEDCIQILTDEMIIPYLLKKKTCTKYYNIFIATPDHIQKKFIEELEKNKPKIILTKKQNQFTPDLKLVSTFIENKYEIYNKFEEWIFLKIRK